MDIYLDTCVLPERGEVRNGALSPLLAFSEKMGHRIVVPELVLDEYWNLRREKLLEATDKLRAALAAADKAGIPMDPVYVPSVEEVVGPVVDELKGLVATVPMDPADAVEALAREARRTRPARMGRGVETASYGLRYCAKRRLAARSRCS